LGIPGDLKYNPNSTEINTNWRSLVFDGEEHYISVLSRKYDDCTENLRLLNKLEPIDITYESFKADKQKSIDRLLEQLGLEKVKDITPILDKQFQPKGQDMTCEDFFGDNLVLLDS
jgi:LPS sulfotransferase NodH